MQLKTQTIVVFQKTKKPRELKNQNQNKGHKVCLWEGGISTWASHTKELFPFRVGGGKEGQGKQEGIGSIVQERKKNLQVNYCFTCMSPKEIFPGSACYISILKIKPNLYPNIKERATKKHGACLLAWDIYIFDFLFFFTFFFGACGYFVILLVRLVGGVHCPCKYTLGPRLLSKDSCSRFS